jgi:hypothetical protein
MNVFWTYKAIGQLENIFNYYKSQANLHVARKETATIVE